MTPTEAITKIWLTSHIFGGKGTKTFLVSIQALANRIVIVSLNLGSDRKENKAKKASGGVSFLFICLDLDVCLRRPCGCLWRPVHQIQRKGHLASNFLLDNFALEGLDSLLQMTGIRLKITHTGV